MFTYCFYPVMNADIYRQLQRHLDKMPVPFPETASGIEIFLLKHWFDAEEAWIALHLSALPETVVKIFARFKQGEISKDLLSSSLERLARKGAIQGISEGKAGPKYSKAPLAIGIFEFQVDRITRELAEDFFKYEDEGFGVALLSARTKQMRTIPIHVNIEPEFPVGNYDNARALIQESAGPYAVMNCVCRQAREKMGKKCQQTDILETCFTLGRSARHMMDRG